MDWFSGRTSVSVDEAAYLLLGWSRVPNEAQYEFDHEDVPFFDALENQMGAAESDLEAAQLDDLSATVILEKRAALEELQRLTGAANAYRCAVNDEINKGEQSMLRVDKGLSNSAYTYITLTSLDGWARTRYDKTFLSPVSGPGPSAAKPHPAKPPVRDKGIRQNKAIKDVLEDLKIPLESVLPYIPGKESEVKKKVKERLLENPLFPTKKSFDRAWDQIREDARESKKPSPIPSHK